MGVIYNKKRITKNVGFLYVRMLLMMFIGLFTSRIVLDQLGAVDFGIYNVVGSLVLLFSFIQGSLSSSASRYMAYEIGAGSEESLNKVFCMTLNIHFIFAFIVLLITETIGLWYFFNKMVLPNDRMYAAFIVFQLSSLSAILTLLTVPYNSMLIAQEKMRDFAYLSIVEAFVKMGIAYCLYFDGFDKLILYGSLLLLSHALVCYLYFSYCRKYFVSTKYQFYWDRNLFKDMMAYNGWSIISYVSANFVSQISNLLLNMFFGPVVNAARAISYQVQTNVQKFVVNFQIALNPQVIKQFATGDKEKVSNLVALSVKISFCLLLIIMFPLLVNVEFLLGLWLKEVPLHTNIFVLFVCIASVFGSMANVFSVIAQAANRLKLFSLITIPLYLAYIPFSYILLRSGAEAWSVLALLAVVQLLELALKFFLAQYILRYNILNVLVIIVRCIITTVLFLLLGLSMRMYFVNESFFSSVFSICFSALIAVSWSVFVIMSQQERKALYSAFKQKIVKK